MDTIYIALIIAFSLGVLSIVLGAVRAIFKDKNRKKETNMLVSNNHTSWANTFIELIINVFYKVERLPNYAPLYQGELEKKDYKEYNEFLSSDIMFDLKSYKGSRFDV